MKLKSPRSQHGTEDTERQGPDALQSFHQSFEKYQDQLAERDHEDIARLDHQRVEVLANARSLIVSNGPSR